MKLCTKCGIEKPLSGYTKDRSKKDGYRTECTDCKRKAKATSYTINKARLLTDPKLTPDTKVCHKCGLPKAKVEFRRNYSSPDGLYAHCKECSNIQRIDWYKENKSDILARKSIKDKSPEYRAKRLEYYKLTRIRRREVAKLSYWNNPEAGRARSNKPTALLQRREYKKKNRPKVAAWQAKRRASKLKATPPWLSKEELFQIEQLYQSAKTLSEFHEEPYHVDHIYPLKGKNSCGLHILANLRVIPARENLSKGNRLIQE